MDLNTVLLALIIPALVTLMKWQRDDGRTLVRTEAKVDDLAGEVEGLREWRHSVGQPLQRIQAERDLSTLDREQLYLMDNAERRRHPRR